MKNEYVHKYSTCTGKWKIFLESDLIKAEEILLFKSWTTYCNLLWQKWNTYYLFLLHHYPTLRFWQKFRKIGFVNIAGDRNWVF